MTELAYTSDLSLITIIHVLHEDTLKKIVTFKKK